MGDENNPRMPPTLVGSGTDGVACLEAKKPIHLVDSTNFHIFIHSNGKI